ncbi:MAG: hypothetical protein K2P53_05055 [Rickettsiales bacterium]|nr:hypothetical protein [Rickettsiales bacterium]
MTERTDAENFDIQKKSQMQFEYDGPIDFSMHVKHKNFMIVFTELQENE